MWALVIDDSRAMRRILGGMLKELGFDVHEAGHGREALDCLQERGTADIALVDWNMPVMDGLEFIKAVRANAALAPMKMLMVTSETEIERVAAALQAGADEYVMKPFDREALRDKLSILGVH